MSGFRVEGIGLTVRKLDEELEDILTVAAIDLWNKIKQKTPVDTGRLRAAWTPSKNPASYKAGDRLVITNPQPYAATVEFGLYPGVGPKTVDTGEGIFSRQAPQGMVRISVEEVADWLERKGVEVIRI